MRGLLIAVTMVISGVPAFGQAIMRPTDAPAVTAAGQSWFRQREPIQVSGETYYRAGVALYFNANQMVPIGHYNGVPIFADATRDPYSVVYVPAGGGLMQPYVRRRDGSLAGTTGSLPPSFPTALRPDRSAVIVAPGAPTSLPVPLGAIGAFTPDGPTAEAALATAVAAVVKAGGLTLSPAVAQAPTCNCDAPVPATATAPFRLLGTAVISARRPDNNDGLWVWYSNAAWVSRGKAEPRTSAFVQIGEREGMPVFRKAATGDETIYLPLSIGSGYLAPYHRKS